MDEVGVAERLADVPRCGAPPRFTAEQVCQIIALACEKPADSGRPISQWSHRELADEIVRRGIVELISPRHQVLVEQPPSVAAFSGNVNQIRKRRARRDTASSINCSADSDTREP